MSAARREVKSSIRLPGPGEDATPFLLRCYVKTVPFRPLNDFEQARTAENAFKLYVWRSATLRDIASLLHMRDPSLSLPTTPHAFRIVYFDAKRGIWTARDAGRGVTRISKSTLEDILDEVVSTDGVDEANVSEAFTKAVQRARPQMPFDADEDSSLRTLDNLNIMDGDVLDCVIKQHPPSLISIKSRSSHGVRHEDSRAKTRANGTERVM